MSGISALKLVATKRQPSADPKVHRRRKLVSKIGEQIQFAKARKEGTTFAPMRFKTIADQETGARRTVELPKRVRPWWWLGDDGKTYLCIKYGAKTLELQKGKNAIEAQGLDEVIATLEVVMQAVDRGDLDAQIETLSGYVKRGFKRETLSLRKSASV
ncbi:MAG: hypothetical protein RI906_715 [Pseudomonadota bacterium]